MDLIQDIINRAKANPQHIVFPEGTEERTLKAADRLLGDGVVRLTLIGDPKTIKSRAQELGLQHIEKAILLDPKQHAKKQDYIDLLLELRRKKGLTEEQAATLVEDPLYLGCLMIKAGDADGELAGAINATGDVLRPALQIVKTTPGISCVSGIFMMFLPNDTYGENGLLLFADCAVMPNPTAAELAQIAVSSAESARGIANVEPMTKYNVAKNKISAHFGRSRVSSSPRPKTDTITKVINGINTPVSTNPKAAVAQCCPAV